MKKIVLLMIIGILISSFHNLNVEIVLADSSSNYYVASDGDDLNNGLSPDSPWRTIGKVNTELNGDVINQGDDIYFKRGDYFNDSELRLRLGGTSTNEMIIGAYGTGDRPMLNYSDDGTPVECAVGSIGYITIQNLEVSAPGPNDNGIVFGLVGLYNITISNCLVHNCTNNGILMIYVNGYLIESCVVRDCNNGGIGVLGSSTYKVTNGTIRNCTIYNIGGNDGISLHTSGAQKSIGNNHLILNCTAYSCGEQAFDFSNSDPDYVVENVMIKDCEGWGNGISTLAVGGFHNFTIDNLYSHDDGSGLIIITRMRNVIVRNCCIYNWSSGAIGALRTYADGTPASDTVENMTVYNNDFIWNTSGWYNLYFGNYTKHHTFKNNIISTVSSAGPGRFFQMNHGNLTSFDYTLINNIWWRPGDDDSDDRWASGGLKNFIEWSALSEVTGDTRQDPKLYDPRNGSFNLTSDSPAIDAGDWLTRTNGGNTGTTITVDNANYFCDGYGLIDGDNIFIGDDSNLEVTDVDYDAETITVNRSITWSDGDAVSLSAYNGSAPDIGAYEFISSGPNTTPPEITNIIRTTSDPLDTSASFGWINITATVTGNSEVNAVMINVSCPNGSSFNVSMNAIGSNTYYYNTNTIFSNHGNYNYFIWANDTNGNQSTSTIYDFSMPPNWDINKDRQCTVLDLILISNHYGETGQNGWIREDVDNNGIIQMPDFVLVSEQYYETW